MEYKIKKLYFGDIRKVAQTINELELTTKQVREIYDLFGELQKQGKFSSVEQADAYLRTHLTKTEYTKLKTLSDEQKMVKAVEVRIEKSDFTQKVIEQGLLLVKILATKFDVIVDFIDYFVENMTREQILQFEGSDTKKVLLAIFTSGGFSLYFKSMFA